MTISSVLSNLRKKAWKSRLSLPGLEGLWPPWKAVFVLIWIPSLAALSGPYWCRRGQHWPHSSSFLVWWPARVPDLELAWQSWRSSRMRIVEVTEKCTVIPEERVSGLVTVTLIFLLTMNKWFLVLVSGEDPGWRGLRGGWGHCQGVERAEEQETKTILLDSAISPGLCSASTDSHKIEVVSRSSYHIWSLESC